MNKFQMQFGRKSWKGFTHRLLVNSMLLYNSRQHAGFGGQRLDRPELDPTCDACKQAPASPLHMFWTCPRPYNFWQSNFNVFSKILEAINPSPFIGLFGVAPQGVHGRNYESHMPAFCAVSARRPLRWTDPLPSVFRQRR